VFLLATFTKPSILLYTKITMTTTSTLPTKTPGITSILNSHYNDKNNNDKFIPDIESDNLKTVLLKIGEVSSNPDETIEQWYARQPRTKKQKLHKIPKNLSSKAKFELIESRTSESDYSFHPKYDANKSKWENFKLLSSTQKGELLSKITPDTRPSEYSKIPENVANGYQDLQKLNGYFHKYFVARKALLKEIWIKQRGDETTIISIKQTFTLLQKYSYKQIVVDGDKKGGIVNEQGEELKPNDIYVYVQKVFQDKIHQCDLHPQFLSNLWSDVAAQYHGYINKLFETDSTFAASKKKLCEFLEKIVKEKCVTDNALDNPYYRERNRLTNIYPVIFKIYSDRNSLDIKDFNLKISELVKTIKLWYDQCPDNDNNPIKNIWNEIQLLSSSNSSIRVKFNHERSFPRFKDDPTLEVLFGKANSYFNDIYSANSDGTKFSRFYDKKLIQFDKKNPTINPFKDSYLTPFDLDNPESGLKEILETELSPNAIAHKYWTATGRSDLSTKIKYVNKLAIQNEDRILDLFYDQPKGQKNFGLLRELAAWIAVRAIAVGLPLSESKRKELIFEVNLVCSNIQNGFKEFEDDFHRESIYLSGMYRDLDQSCGYLCTNLENQNLSLLVDFENTIQKGDSTLKTLIYTNDSDKEYVFDEENPLEYINYNKPLWKPQSVDLSFNTLFNLPLHFGVNQSRKYFWNKTRVGSENQNVHNIFDPKSRLKVSSMRLIRKHNPVTNVWEYYLSLAIYRLEKSEVNMDLSQSKSIVGVDFGENQLAAFTHCDLNGKFISSRNFDENLTKHVLELHKSIEKQIEIENYASPVSRKKLANKLKSAVQQASSEILKLNLDNNIVVFEQDAKSKTKHIATNQKDGKGFQKTTLLKGFKLLERSAAKARSEIDPKVILNKTYNISKSEINKKDILGIVPTDPTSKICSCCGHGGDHEKEINLVALKNFFVNSNNVELINLLDFVPHSDFIVQDYPDLFILDTSKICNMYNKTTYKDEIQEWKVKYSLDSSEKIKFLESMFTKRPKWFEGNVETFRCLNCGHIEYNSCDKQASLNIARWRVYIEEKKVEKIVPEFEKIKFLEWYKEQIANDWETPGNVRQENNEFTQRSNRA
jgi:hypothetical protein